MGTLDVMLPLQFAVYSTPQVVPIALDHAFSSSAAAEVCEILKRLQIIGPAVGIARVVHGVHAQHELIGTSRFGEAESDRDEHGVSPWYIRIRMMPSSTPLVGRVWA